MTERTRSPHARPAQEERAPEGTVDEAVRTRWSDIPVRLRIALGLSVVGSALLVLGPVKGLVHNAPAAGFAATPLLIALAVLAPVLAGAAVWLGRPVIAAGVLIGFALLAPGRALVDLQFAKDPTLVARPELMLPASLAPLTAAAGLWLLIAGHLVAMAAGVLAGGARTEVLDGAGEAQLPARHYLMGWAFACATVATVGLILPPFHSTDAFLLARDVIDSPALVRVGGLLVVAGVVLGSLMAASSARPELTKGVLLGLFGAVAGVTLPGIVAGFEVRRLRPAIGPYLALIMVGVLALVVFVLPGLLTTLRRRLASRPGGAAAGERADETRLGDQSHRAAGILGVLAGLATLIGGLGSQLTVDAGLEQPVSYANRQLVPVAALIGVLGVALLVRRTASAVRPAFTVSLASVFLVGASTLDADLTATSASAEVHLGVGVWFAGLAMIIAAIAAVLAALAGAAERDDVDLTERGTNLAVVVPAAAAVLLAIGAFGLPAVRAPDFVAPGIWSEFRLASWGLLFALVVVIVVAVLAPGSRPAQAASLLLGATALVGIHLLELPLTGARAAQATAGQGTWLSLACAAALVAAAVAALITRRVTAEA
jgi:hypothetical protein